MCDRDWNTCQQTQCDEALFAVRKAVIFVGEGQSLEDTRRINEVDCMSRRLIARLRSDK